MGRLTFALSSSRTFMLCMVQGRYCSDGEGTPTFFAPLPPEEIGVLPTPSTHPTVPTLHPQYQKPRDSPPLPFPR